MPNQLSTTCSHATSAAHDIEGTPVWYGTGMQPCSVTVLLCAYKHSARATACTSCPAEPSCTRHTTVNTPSCLTQSPHRAYTHTLPASTEKQQVGDQLAASSQRGLDSTRAEFTCQRPMRQYWPLLTCSTASRCRFCTGRHTHTHTHGRKVEFNASPQRGGLSKTQPIPDA